jgi:hypothetical protein
LCGQRDNPKPKKTKSKLEKPDPELRKPKSPVPSKKSFNPNRRKNQKSETVPKINPNPICPYERSSIPWLKNLKTTTKNKGKY